MIPRHHSAEFEKENLTKLPEPNKFLMNNQLRLVSAGLAASTSLLLLVQTLGGDARARGRVRHTGGLSKVAVGLAGLLGAAQQHSVLALGALESELIKRQALTASRQNALTSTARKTKRTDRHFRHFEETRVIRDGAHNNSNLALLLALHRQSQSGRRDGGARSAALVETLEHHLVESGSGTARQEAEQLRGERCESRPAQFGGDRVP